MATKSYGFAIGNLRARENTLLKSSDMSQLAGCKNVDDLTAALLDKGYGDRLRDHDVAHILESSRLNLWDYLEQTAPDFEVFTPFIIEYDFHNLKAVLKALIKNIDPAEYLLEPSVCPTNTIVEAIKDKKFEILPNYMQSAAERAYGILTSSGDAQLCDAVIDSACMKTQLELAEQKDYKCDLAADMIKQMVFYRNIKAALRCAKAQKDAAFLDETLIHTPFLGKTSLKNAVLGGVDKVLELLRSIGKSAAADAFESSATDFERFCDNAVTEVAKKARYVTLGSEPIIGYYWAREIEEKNIRIIYSAVKVGQAEEKTIGRLREAYV